MKYDKGRNDMKNALKTTLMIVAVSALLFGCATPQTRIVSNENDRSPTTLGLDYRDFEAAASDMVQSMLSSGATRHPGGGRYVLAISRITNDTSQRIDTDQLIKKIRVELLNSGTVAVTTAVGLSGPEDEMNYAARELRGNREFDQRGVAREGQLQAPDLSLSGKIIQRTNTISKREQRVDYYFQLTLTQIETGLAIWEEETPISKIGSSKTVSW